MKIQTDSVICILSQSRLYTKPLSAIIIRRENHNSTQSIIKQF